jgi:hypothetical protein
MALNVAAIGESIGPHHQDLQLEGRRAVRPGGGGRFFIYDKGKGKGALVIGRTETWHSNGRKLFTGTVTIFGRLDGGFGGANAPDTTVAFPRRQPDVVTPARVSPDQPLLYRLVGRRFSAARRPGVSPSCGI